MREKETGILIENNGKLTLTPISNLNELLEHDQGKELRVLVKKDPNESQSEYESSGTDQTPKPKTEKPALVVPKVELAVIDGFEQSVPTPKPKLKRKRSSTTTKLPKKEPNDDSVSDKPKTKKRKRSSSIATEEVPKPKRRKKSKTE